MRLFARLALADPSLPWLLSKWLLYCGGRVGHISIADKMQTQNGCQHWHAKGGKNPTPTLNSGTDRALSVTIEP